ncbi:hypothetical protein P700755_000872 [Psychroflexus torquis ATCC 700755]|uniref:Uncharacterized protein n=1 Tax=Psychroflexus torquis (strain ATCC 700755 / CIP 106069 / ACAM 623) TaxID=313595 RepID=K4IFJ0_PSYTT|nr:hypothetical protein P700755_000872 [Psychroflexus torquis ATCC 700755]
MDMLLLTNNKINEGKSLFAYFGKEKLTLEIFKVDTLTGLIPNYIYNAV